MQYLMQIYGMLDLSQISSVWNSFVIYAFFSSCKLELGEILMFIFFYCVFPKRQTFLVEFEKNCLRPLVIADKKKVNSCSVSFNSSSFPIKIILLTRSWKCKHLKKVKLLESDFIPS